MSRDIYNAVTYLFNVAKNNEQQKIDIFLGRFKCFIG